MGSFWPREALSLESFPPSVIGNPFSDRFPLRSAGDRRPGQVSCTTSFILCEECVFEGVRLLKLRDSSPAAQNDRYGVVDLSNAPVLIFFRFLPPLASSCKRGERAA